MQDDIKTEHENNKRARSRYKIVIPVRGGRRTLQHEQGTFTGDVVEEYWDGKLIRDHKFIVTEYTVKPTQADYNYYAQNPYPGSEPRDRVEYKPTFATNIYDMTNVPQEIINGQWTNPTNGPTTSYTATQRRGAWGIYAEDYVDAYTRQCIDPIVQKYTDKVEAMRAAIIQLQPNPRKIRYHGVIDNISEMQSQITEYIQSCDAQIEQANRTLGISGSGTLTSNLAQLQLLGR